jgi:hypothetical protein
MERVVAWPGDDEPGYVNLHWLPAQGNGMRGKPFRDLNEFMDFAQYAACKPATYKEIYYCLSSHTITGKVVHGHATAFRNRSTVHRLKAIWLDIDARPEKPECYGTAVEAFAALTAFITAARMPPASAVVQSGYGLQVYWISDVPLTLDVWRQYAEGLKAEAGRLGLKADLGVSADPVRVLRVPGTFNNKKVPPRAVRLVHLGASINFPTALPHLAAAAPAASRTVTAAVTASQSTPFSLAPFAGKKMAAAFQHLNPQADNLADGIGGKSDLPLDPTQVFRGCAHYRDAFLTHGAGHAEPLWNLTVLGASWFENGRAIAHTLSNKHPGYQMGDTDAKLDQKLTARANGTGWPSCSQFEGAGAACKTCPFYGRIKSPLNLANRVQAPGPVSAPPPPPPEDLELPGGYTVDPATGYICRIIQKDLPGGVTVNETQPLFLCKIRNLHMQRGNRKLMFETSLDADSWGEVAIPEVDLASDQTFIKSLRLHGVKPNPKQQKEIVQFMTNWTAKLDAAKKRLSTIAFGWLRNEAGGAMPIGFAYGGRVIMAGAPEQPSGFTDAQLESVYKPIGSAAPWWEAVKMVTDQLRPANEAIIATSFAAPLMFATGLYNGVFCVWSNESGSHKSTAIYIGAAVWANPNLSRVRQISSQKSILRKVGHIKNLPVYLDEISEVAAMDEVRKLVNQLTEGADGDKMFQDRTFQGMESWQTLMLVGSNQSLVENITRNVTGTDAKLQRVFEFQVPKRPASHDSNHVTNLINSLDYNYGHMGMLYSQLLGSDPAGIAKFVQDLHTDFNKQVNFQTEERFRSAMAVCTYAGAALANTLGCEFHLPELWAFLKEQYLMQRQQITSSASVGGTEANTVNQMTYMTKHYIRNILTVQELPMRRKGHPVAVAYISGPTRQRPDRVHIRCSITDRVIDVSRKALNDYITLVEGSSGAVIDGLTRHFGATIIEKVDLAAGADVQGGRETIVRIPVPAGSPFEGILFTNVPMDARPLALQDDVTAVVIDPNRVSTSA